MKFSDVVRILSTGAQALSSAASLALTIERLVAAARGQEGEDARPQAAA